MTFTAPGSGASATLSAGTAAIGADGTASITATANGTAGTYIVTASARGAATPASFALTNQPNQPNQAPAITSASTTTFTVGQAGSFTITTTGFPTATISEVGALPSGVTLTDQGNGTATLSGNPATGTQGTYPFTITAANGILPDATQSFTLTVAVNQAPAITSANSTTFTVGQAGSFTITTTGFPTAAISEVGALPSGVTLTDQGNGTATLSGNPATGTQGTYPFTITAANGISPDATQSFTLTVAVNQAPAITSANSTTFTVGQAGSFTITTTGFPTATISEVGALPSGVTLTDQGNGTATLSGNPATGTQGTYPFTITAANGTLPDATQSFTLTVQAATTTTLIASPNPSVFGQTVRFVAQVANTSGTGPVPDGQVQFYDGTTQIGGDVTLDASGIATLSTSDLLPSTQAHAITAQYLGNDNFQASTSATQSQMVNKASTTTSLVASANPSVFGQNVTFTAFVTATAPGTGTPNGQAQLYVDGSAVGAPFTLTGGQGSITIAHFNNLIGDHTVQVNYLGSANYKGSDSVVDVQTVNPVATTTTLSSALNPSKYGQSVMLTATVQATAGTIQPTCGTVQFWDGTVLLGSASLANSNQASFSISALAAGSHSLTAVLLASANFQTSTSGSIMQQVVKNQTVVQLGCAMAQATATPAIDPAAITAAARTHRKVVFTILVHPAGVPAYPTTGGTATMYQSNGRFVATLPVRNGQATLSRYLCLVFQKSYYAVYNGTPNLGRRGRTWSG